MAPKVRTNIKNKYESEDATNTKNMEECVSCGISILTESLSPSGLCPDCVINNLNDYSLDNNGCW